MRNLVVTAFALILATSACTAQETMAPIPESDAVWGLVTLDGAPFEARATIGFPEPGLIAGEAPCNSYSGELRGSFPAFELGPLRVTRLACTQLEAERAFFTALAVMTEAEAADDALILSGPEGRRMVFNRLQP
ncbi:META domain-containing protein [Defluviimonas sp. WL0002]|uniref:META domain-containing protein n=1 Tax=Albidovulum marisflavi TaxID=2984159 RepID=A0ABT2ZA09_9RHOB|nr:META domain-containing protein [Defluviimonas sp. WL0002]MCV2867980.1 META domain-containing protein [Defluviimonas sp. WL0002]